MLYFNKKGLVIYWIVMFIAIAMCLLNIDRDYMTYQGNVDNIAVVEDYTTAIANGQEYTGLVTYGPDLSFHKGSYHIMVEYTSESDQNYLEVVSYSQNNGFNELGKVYSVQELSKDNTSLSFDVMFDQDVQNLEVRNYAVDGNITVSNYSISSNGVYCTDAYCMSIVILLLFVLMRKFLIVKAKEEQNEYIVVPDIKRFFLFAFPIVIGFIATIPMMNDIIYQGHDMYFHLLRIEGIADGIRDGQFPVRINTVFANGYGYINSIMYPELFMYFPALLRICGISLVTSYKLFCLVMNILAAFIAFWSFKKITKSDKMGIVFCILYTLASYRFVNLYVRTAIGEWLSMLFLPLILLGMYQIMYGEEKEWWYATLGFTCVFQSHLINTELSIIVTAVFVIASVRQFKVVCRFLALLKAIIMTILINLWFIIPFVYYYRWDLWVFHNPYELSTNATYLSQLFTGFWFTGGVTMDKGITLGEQPESVGILLGIGILVYVFIVLCTKRLSKEEKKLGTVMLILGLLTLFFSSTLAPWIQIEKIPLIGPQISSIQYAWRWLGLATLFLCGVTTIAIHGAFIGQNEYKTIGIVSVICIMLFAVYADNYSGTVSSMITNKNIYTFDTTMLYGNQYFLRQTDGESLFSKGAVIVTTNPDVVISNFKKKGTNIEFNFKNDHGDEKIYLDLPLYHYAGYKVILDGETEMKQMGGTNNEIRIELPNKSSGHVEVHYKGVVGFRIADAITLITLTSVIIVYIRRKHKMGIADLQVLI